MKLHRASLRCLSLAVLALAVTVPAGAQEKGSVRVNIQVPDSVAHVVDRQSAAQSAFAIVSRDGTAALLLFDTTIVAQMRSEERRVGKESRKRWWTARYKER